MNTTTNNTVTLPVLEDTEISLNGRIVEGDIWVYQTINNTKIAVYVLFSADYYVNTSEAEYDGGYKVWDAEINFESIDHVNWTFGETYALNDELELVDELVTEPTLWEAEAVELAINKEIDSFFENVSEEELENNYFG